MNICHKTDFFFKKNSIILTDLVQWKYLFIYIKAKEENHSVTAFWREIMTCLYCLLLGFETIVS